MTSRRPVAQRLAAVAVTLVALLGSASLPPASASVAPETARLRTGSHPAAGVAYHAFWTGRTDAQRREMFRRLSEIGARWVRISLPWALAQPRRPTSSDSGWSAWGLDQIDTVVRMAARQGLQISFTFVGTPDWANGGRGPKYLPTDPGTYARAVRFLAARYRTNVQSWEIWNEANGEAHLRGASLGDYVRLLCRAHPAVHRGSPSARVVSAGTGGVDWEWIRGLYRAGAKHCFDVLAVHPYIGDISPRHKYNPSSDGPPLWLQKMAEVRRVMKVHGDRATPVWFTEFGWQTPPGGTGGVTRQQQADYLVQMMSMTDARLPYVRRMCWYTSRDEVSSYYGLYTADMRAKPAAGAMRSYLAQRG